MRPTTILRNGPGIGSELNDAAEAAARRIRRLCGRGNAIMHRIAEAHARGDKRWAIHYAEQLVRVERDLDDARAALAAANVERESSFTEIDHANAQKVSRRAAASRMKRRRGREGGR